MGRGNWIGQISVALPSCQAKVLKTPEVAEFTVEELQILETWAREQGQVRLGSSSVGMDGVMWPSQDVTASAGLVREGVCGNS